jgi:hypothetical protein
LEKSKYAAEISKCHKGEKELPRGELSFVLYMEIQSI